MPPGQGAGGSTNPHTQDWCADLPAGGELAYNCPAAKGPSVPPSPDNTVNSGSPETSNAPGARAPAPALLRESLSSPGLSLTPTALRRKPTPKPGQGVWAEAETPPPGVPDLCPRPGLRASPRGHWPAGGAAFCVFRFEVPETPQPSGASPRGPRPLLSESPAPLLGSACQLGARWFAPRGARRRGEGRQPPPPRAAPEPSGAGGTRRRRSCGPDCSSGPPASRSSCRGPRPAATPGGSRPGISPPRGKRLAPLSCPAAGALPAWGRGAPGSRRQPRVGAPFRGAVRARAQPRGSGQRDSSLFSGREPVLRPWRGLSWQGPGGWGGRSRRWVSPSESALGRGPLARAARDVPPGLRSGWPSLANGPPRPRRPLWGWGLPLLPGCALAVDLGTAGLSPGYVSVSACVCARGRGWGVCPFALSRLMPHSPRVSSRPPGRRGLSACVRDAPSEGTRCQRAAWPAATASGGAQGGGPARLAARTCVPQPPPVPAQMGPAPRRSRAFQPPVSPSPPARGGSWGRSAPAHLRVRLHQPPGHPSVRRFGDPPVPFRAPAEERELPAPLSRAAAIIALAGAAGETALPAPPTPQGPASLLLL